jgi:hypothetical protein
MLVGIISDTHGLMRPEAIAALQGSVIIHAGDVGKPEVVDKLNAIAPNPCRAETSYQAGADVAGYQSGRGRWAAAFVLPRARRHPVSPATRR